jgi:hypothetical protein
VPLLPTALPELPVPLVPVPAGAPAPEAPPAGAVAPVAAGEPEEPDALEPEGDPLEDPVLFADPPVPLPQPASKGNDETSNTEADRNTAQKIRLGRAEPSLESTASSDL